LFLYKFPANCGDFLIRSKILDFVTANCGDCLIRSKILNFVRYLIMSINSILSK